MRYTIKREFIHPLPNQNSKIIQKEPKMNKIFLTPSHLELIDELTPKQAFDLLHLLFNSNYECPQPKELKIVYKIIYNENNTLSTELSQKIENIRKVRSEAGKKSVENRRKCGQLPQVNQTNDKITRDQSEPTNKINSSCEQFEPSLTSYPQNFEKVIHNLNKIEQNEQKGTKGNKINSLKERKVINNKYINIFSTCMEEADRVPIQPDEDREIYYKFFDNVCNGGLWTLTGDWKEALYEVIDTLIEAFKQAEEPEGLKFRQKTYYKAELTDVYLNIPEKRLFSLLNSLVVKKDIKNRPFYILGAIVKASEEKLRKEVKSE